VAPPWDFDQQAQANHFLAQVWHADHDHDEQNFYDEESIYDILNADLEWEGRAKT
jgi:hypothetical protein